MNKGILHDNKSLSKLSDSKLQRIYKDCQNIGSSILEEYDHQVAENKILSKIISTDLPYGEIKKKGKKNKKKKPEKEKEPLIVIGEEKKEEEKEKPRKVTTKDKKEVKTDKKDRMQDKVKEKRVYPGSERDLMPAAKGKEIEKKKAEKHMKPDKTYIPAILNEASDNLDVLTVRKALKKAWLASSISKFEKALESAKLISKAEGFLDQEIKLSEAQLQKLVEEKKEKRKATFSTESEIIGLDRFVFEKTLNNCPENCKIYLLGTLLGDPTDAKAILVLQKTEFQEAQLYLLGSQSNADNEDLKVSPLRHFNQYFHNSEFRKYWLRFDSELSRVQSDFIYPASDSLIAKYTKQDTFTVRETAEVYKTVVKPHFIDPMDMSHCNWVYQILERKKEEDLRVFENDKFMLQKDWKFNAGDISTLYCLAIPTQRDLRSIRDLNADHLPLLKSIYNECFPAIEKTFGVPSSKILAYFHYQPTYFHLHVHFMHVDKQERDSRETVSLDEVISNIEIVSDYYQRCTMVYQVGSQRPLFKVLEEHGVVEPVEELPSLTLVSVKSEIQEVKVNKPEENVLEEDDEVKINKPEDKVQEKAEDKVQEKAEDKVQEKAEEKVQEVAEEKVQEKAEEKVQEKAEEQVQEEAPAKDENKKPEDKTEDTPKEEEVLESTTDEKTLVEETK